MLAVICGYYFTTKIIQPMAFDSLCWTNTNNCLQIKYQKFQNSALIHVINSGFWLWFSGRYLIMYQTAPDLSCEDNYEPAIIYDFMTYSLTKYCVGSLDSIKYFYDNNEEGKIVNNLFLNVPNANNYDAYMIMQIFFDKNLLFI